MNMSSERGVCLSRPSHASKRCRYRMKQMEQGDDTSQSTCQDIKIHDEVKPKIKVELCRNYLENKVCPYKQRCKFAHGLGELLQNTELGQNFRTKKCKVFFDQMWCRFGERCNFKHEQIDNKLRSFTHSNLILQNYPEMLLSTKSYSAMPWKFCQSASQPSP